ncbi:MAG: sulfur carrier protein ThiS [Acidobacteria bacterium]|nr:sulfur carrier protein ThiS [Acidobacteriota bacterium]
MKIIINGEEREFNSLTTLAELVEQLGTKPDRIAIEVNRELIPRERWAGTALTEGDRLEIVHFVGGGLERQFSHQRAAGGTHCYQRS